ncbi:hypothetical protein M438DRAFT_349906 [Aureobasidium pullulans EXF-150]|uniref:Uncharacterized protein n=1 Tax=Aureobasidium pullulans EXF-150 TaxID=1043002 RepID=A0A074XX35_AURPU|nr:uncharacterized protein M438DRAFT_349906 [Aureobasidium pullulans EXF-150]KEQ79236.1 hypothetical protein M438DRAFT_349906 [Aureobasidium pullulans EXF-150]
MIPDPTLKHSEYSKSLSRHLFSTAWSGRCLVLLLSYLLLLYKSARGYMTPQL